VWPACTLSRPSPSRPPSAMCHIQRLAPSPWPPAASPSSRPPCSASRGPQRACPKPLPWHLPTHDGARLRAPQPQRVRRLAQLWWPPSSAPSRRPRPHPCARAPWSAVTTVGTSCVREDSEEREENYSVRENSREEGNRPPLACMTPSQLPTCMRSFFYARHSLPCMQSKLLHAAHFFSYFFFPPCSHASIDPINRKTSTPHMNLVHS
jgi:hypothetical protein